jgi:uncharacterized protein (DUF433 family)
MVVPERAYHELSTAMKGTAAIRQLYDLDRLVEMPIYPLSVAARYGHVPVSTVEDWVTGRDYPTKAGGLKRSKPMIFPADGRGDFLSFTNLTEVHVLSAIRKVHRIPMKDVRACVEFLRNAYNDPHPLANPKMRTNGVTLFLDEATHLVNLGRSGQLAIRDIMDASLRRIVHEGATPVTLFPWLAGPTAKEAPQLIAIDPRIAFGKPHLVKSGTPTAAVYLRHHSGGESKSRLADDLGESAAAIDEALRLEQRPKAA